MNIFVSQFTRNLMYNVAFRSFTKQMLTFSTNLAVLELLTYWLQVGDEYHYTTSLCFDKNKCNPFRLQAYSNVVRGNEMMQIAVATIL